MLRWCQWFLWLCCGCFRLPVSVQEYCFIPGSAGFLKTETERNTAVIYACVQINLNPIYFPLSRTFHFARRPAENKNPRFAWNMHTWENPRLHTDDTVSVSESLTHDYHAEDCMHFITYMPCSRIYCFKWRQQYCFWNLTVLLWKKKIVVQYLYSPIVFYNIFIIYLILLMFM